MVSLASQSYPAGLYLQCLLVTGARKRTSLKAALSQAYLRVTSTVGKTTTRQPKRPKVAFKVSKSLGKHLIAIISFPASLTAVSIADTTRSADSGTFVAQANDDNTQR